MSDAGENGDIEECFVEDENKVKIEETTLNFGCVKNESNESLDFEDDSCTTQYRITLEYENIFGEPSQQIKIEEDYDNLIGFLDNDVIMENAMIKLDTINEEDGSFNNFYCSKCKGIYKGYCLKCSSLLHILNNSPLVNFESEPNTIPTDILEIRETSRGKGVYLLRTLPMNIIFGPFEGILRIESTVGHSWKVTDNKLRNIESGNWMKHIVCAASVSLKNLDIFQTEGNLYFRTNREIAEGEELLLYYDDEQLQQLDNREECLYTPQRLEKFQKIFACTMCCLGFGSNKCLMEHKRKCRMENSRGMKDFVLVECHYCKMWMEKWEHEEYHVAYCLGKHYRMWSDNAEAVDRRDANVKEMRDDCGTKDGKRTYRRDICSRSYDGRDDSQLDRNDYQCVSGGNDETCLNECALTEHLNNEQIQNIIELNKKSRFQNHLNKHKGIKSIKCDICMKKFTMNSSLAKHIRNKHTDNGGEKNYKCSECSYETNLKNNLGKHLNMHRGIRPFNCDICMKKFTQKYNLQNHIKHKHTVDGSTKDYKCSDCSYQTNYKSHLQRHMNKHRGIRPFTCDICLMKFTEKGHLVGHVKTKHTTNAESKKHQCSDCFFQTNRKDHLQDHLNTHKGIKPFTCDICMMKYSQKDSLKKHITNKHTDGGSAKDYKCLECSYQTSKKSNFQRHQNKHRGIKTFKCDICMMKFTEKGNLTKHIKNKHTDDGSVKNYKCLECAYQTSINSHLQKHLNEHRGIKFQCYICMAKFTQKGNLTRHIKNKHTNDGNAKH